MYRLQIYQARSWRWGIKDYTLEEAKARINELKAIGIRARVKPATELFN